MRVSDAWTEMVAADRRLADAQVRLRAVVPGKRIKPEVQARALAAREQFKRTLSDFLLAANRP